MTKSRAKKLREKQVREGGLDPQMHQSFFTKNKNGFNFTTERTDKSLRDKLDREDKNTLQKIKQSYVY